MLKLNAIEVKYSGIILVLRGVSIELPDGAIVALLGANGAGKTTTLNAISGLLRLEAGRVTAGSIEFDGMRIEKNSSEQIVKMGITHVMEGRRIFEHLMTEENLMAGAHLRNEKAAVKCQLELVYNYFPRLKPLRHKVSGYLSGGEQQMLVIGRAMMAVPKLMMLDEPSLGLAPILMKEVFAILEKFNQEQGTALLLVEQNAMLALDVAKYAYVMETGRIMLSGPGDQLKKNEDIKEFYLGFNDMGEKKIYSGIKHHRKRKRWFG